MEQSSISQQSVVDCFTVLTNPNPNPTMQKQADAYLYNCQQSCSQFIGILLTIFESHPNDIIKLQSLICFSNVIKRNYLNKRIKDSTLPNFQKLKTSIKEKLIEYAISISPAFRKTLLDIIIFIAQIDYPHNFDQLTIYMEQMLDNVQDVDFLKQNLKALVEIYKKKQKRSIVLNKKHFQQSSLKILVKLFNLSQSLFEKIQQLDQKQFSLLRSIMKLKLLILTTAPNDIIDNEQMLKAVESIFQKMYGVLVILVTETPNNQIKKNSFDLEHLYKSLIEYFSALQYKHPFSLVLCFTKYLHLIIHTINNHEKFNNQQVLKYAIIALTKVLKTYIYYSSQTQFQTSSFSKSKCVNFLSFRVKIHAEYKQIINQQNIQTLLSKLISQIMSLKDYDTFDTGIGVQDEEGKMDQSEASLQRLSLLLIQTIVNRFPVYSYNLIQSLVNACISAEFVNIDKSLKVNIMNVSSILPAALKGANSSLLMNFPIQSLISFAFNSSDLADKFALLSCKWIHKFSPEETVQIVNALIAFIDANSNNVGMLLECCLAIKTIILNKSNEVDLSGAVEKVIPIAIKLFSSTQSIQVLWPMITMISKLITSVECSIQTIQTALACNSLVNLIQTNQQLIIQALCQMFRNILCTLARDQPQPITYDLVLNFLSNQLPKTHIAGYEQVLKLWYLTLREYDRIQSKDNQLKYLFQKFYKIALQSTFNQKLLYILEQYVLLDLIESNLESFISILIEFYDHGSEDSTEDEKYKLKIAATSVHITFITKFGIANAHNNELLMKYLDDLVETTNNPVHNKLSDTFKTSIMTVINRYIIMFKEQFFTFLNGTKHSFNQFLRAWFIGMESLTSKTACKINAIALLQMTQNLQSGLLKNRFQFIMKKVIPQIADVSTIPFQAKVGISPTYRLSENILSQRKQSIRREGVFQDIDLKGLFITVVKNLVEKNFIDQQSIEMMLGGDKVLLDSFYRLAS